MVLNEAVKIQSKLIRCSIWKQRRNVSEAKELVISLKLNINFQIETAILQTLHTDPKIYICQLFPCNDSLFFMVRYVFKHLRYYD